MPKLYQHELRSNLRALNEGTEPDHIDIVIDKCAAYINLNKKYFPEDHLIIFDEIVKESLSFESFFSLLLHSPAVQERPTRIFLPSILYDICTDHKYQFIGKTHQKLIKIIRSRDEESPEKDPKVDNLYSVVINCKEERINSEFASRKGRAHHTLCTGNWLVEFLKSQIEREKEEQESFAGEVHKESSWADRVSTEASSSEVTTKIPQKKSVRFAE